METIICDINEDPGKEIRCLSLLKQLNINGIIIAPASENAEYNCSFLKELHNSGLPIIMLDRDVKGIGLSGVFQNSYDGAYNAVNKLIELGHERIATVAGPITSKPGLDRMVGYMDALKNHGIAVRQEYILYGDFKTESGFDLTRQLLREHPQVTAIFSANNLMSIGSLRAIQDAGLSTPEDIAFISYGSLNPYEVNSHSNITELVEPTELMGNECAQLMLEKMAASNKKSFHVAKRVSYDTSLLLRGSEAFPIHHR
ncbi:MAG: substrate-binding domain-containing protein [Eubacteriales bacterium]|nr:substrate-binding domain-containing protein [Eubacteriales bacterium]